MGFQSVIIFLSFGVVDESESRDLFFGSRSGRHDRYELALIDPRLVKIEPRVGRARKRRLQPCPQRLPAFVVF